MLRTPSTRGFLQIGVIFLVLLACTHLSAAEGELSKKQKTLNDDAIKGMIAGEFEKAIELLNESLALGELNVTYLNLGRAYAKVGRCQEALGAYDRMAVAPRVKAPTPEALYEILMQYRGELFEQCPGEVILRCSPAEIMVSVDGGEAQACPSAKFELSAGEHSFEGIAQGRTTTQTAEVRGMSTTYVDLRVDVSPVFTPVQEEPSPVLAIVGWSTVGTGIVLLGVGVVMDLSIGSDIDAFNTLMENGDLQGATSLQSDIASSQKVSAALFISGTGLAALGAGLLLSELLNAETPAEVGASMGASPDGASLQLYTRF